MKLDAWLVIASLVCLALLLFGLRSAFMGIEWRRRRANLIEGAVLAFWFAALGGIPTQNPAIVWSLAVAGFLLGVYLSGKYVSYLYGLTGALVLLSIGVPLLMSAWFFPVLGWPLWIDLGLLGTLAMVGFRAGRRLRSVIVLITTALGGAQYTTTALLGIPDILAGHSALFLGTLVLEAMPVVGMILQILDPMELVVFWLIVAIVFIVGAGHQVWRYGPDHGLEWLSRRLPLPPRGR